MADFSGYGKGRITGRTARFVVDDLASWPITFEVAPAIGNANKAYRLELMRVQNVARETEKAAAKTPEQQLEAALKIEGGIVNAICESVVVGWSGVIDSSTGESVAFSKETLREFLSQAPEDLTDRIYSFASNPKNFQLEAPDVISKNSERG